METQTSHPLRDIIIERMEAKGLNTEKLGEIINVQKRFLDGLLGNNVGKLPAAPYIRNYLLKIGQVLDLNGEDLWQLYRKETSIKTSGPTDQLPDNRFANPSISRRKVLIGALIIAAIFCLIFGIAKLTSSPRINITNPADEITTTSTSTITLTGNIKPENKLTINGENVYVNDNGDFRRDLNLQVGLNTIEFSAKKILGKKTKVIRQVIYQP